MYHLVQPSVRSQPIQEIEIDRPTYYSGSMTSSQESSSLPSVLLRLLSQDWLGLLPDLYRALRLWVRRYRHEGMYEILDYDSILELVDPKGETAIFKKHQKVKFLQDHIIAFQDYAWGEGDIFADYTCTPGVVVDRYREGDRWNILISLQETKSAGSVTEFYIERIVKQGFTQAEESRQIEIRNQTRRLKVVIIFPKKRHCQRAVILQRSQHRTFPLGPEHFLNLPDGRQQLTWETQRINRFEIYTIKWVW